MYQIVLRFIRKYDFSFMGAICAIFFIGILNLYSASHSQIIEGELNLFQKQIVYFVLAMSVGFLVSLLHPKAFFRFSYIIYGINVFLLILVYFVGKKGMGAQRWLSLGPISIQPSEFMKISVCLALSRYFARSEPHRSVTLKDLIIPSILAGIPAILIIRQPDLGTGLVILLIYSFLIFYRRLNLKTVAILTFFSLIAGLLMYQFGLKEYQKKRILTFIDPTQDARGSGYNAIQSEIAIGSGQIFGKGFMKSSQASLNYLPENQTDFVFSVFNEEHGFFGAIVIIVLYIIVFLRIIWLSQSVLKTYDSFLLISLFSIFFWHTFINMGMVMGLMPIVGLPLPFFSYGGSSLLTFGICIGMITSMSNSKSIF